MRPLKRFAMSAAMAVDPTLNDTSDKSGVAVTSKHG
jgi:hypothetical protein